MMHERSMTEVLVDDAHVEYPTSDGRPVAETPLHYQRLGDAAYVLGKRFESQPHAYVGANMLVYDEPGNPKRHLSPDLFVAFGVEDRERDIYKLWEEEAPSFVLELTSKSTHREDEMKKARYARWGVDEYVLYDPRAEYVRPPLQFFRLSGPGYRPMAPGILGNGKRGFASNALGLGLWLDGLVLRFLDPVTGQNLLTPNEAVARADAEAATARVKAAREATRADEEAEQRRRLEAELAELRNRYESERRPQASGPPG